MHFKQTKNYGCGVYSISNSLQLDDFITNKKLTLSKNGNNVGQLNKWLSNYGIKCFVSCIAYNNEEIVKIFDLKPIFITENIIEWVPFFITIKSNEKRSHMIGCRYMNDGRIIAHDSMKEKEDVYDNFNEFKEKYESKVVAFELLRNYQNEAIFMKLNN